MTTSPVLGPRILRLYYCSGACSDKEADIHVAPRVMPVNHRSGKKACLGKGRGMTALSPSDLHQTSRDFAQVPLETLLVSELLPTQPCQFRLTKLSGSP